MKNSNCSSSRIVEIVLLGISELEKVSKKDLSLKKQLRILRKALRDYQYDCNYCKSRANSDQKCMNEALVKLARQMPFIKDSIYPWKNYDWDYGNYIDNNYSAKATGSSSDGRAYINNSKIFIKLFNAYIFNANPDSKSRAGGKNKSSDYPIYGCQGNNRNNCLVWNYIKNRNRQNAPYRSSFFNKNTSGEHSSSYFIKVGKCARPDINNQKKCLDRNYEWTRIDDYNGMCYQPRYAYLNNKPGLDSKLKGYIPSQINDILSLSPDKLFTAYQGLDIPGYLNVQKCPKFTEQFKPYSKAIFTRPKLLFKHDNITDLDSQKNWLRLISFTNMPEQIDVFKESLVASFIIVVAIILTALFISKNIS